MIAKLRVVLSIPIFFFSFCAWSQIEYWKPATPGEAVPENYLVSEGGERLNLYSLEESAFSADLQGISTSGLSEKTLSFPDKDGRIMRFRVRETPVFAPGLAARYPGIRSFTPEQQPRRSGLVIPIRAFKA